jgi:hypothetical protein
MAKITINYSQNQADAPASLMPREDVERSPYAPKLNDAHERIIANGVKSNSQLRKVDSKPEVAPAYGMRCRGADAAVKVPAKTTRK